MADAKKYIIDDYEFVSRQEYERALKEKETIAYIVANTNMSDMKALLKVYNRAIEKGSFKTVIGLEFIRNMRKSIIASGFMSDENVSRVPVQMIKTAQNITGGSNVKSGGGNVSAAQIKQYQEAFEAAKAGKTIRNMVIGFLSVIIIVMLVITYKTKYSVFTYFTDYETNIENEVINKYEKWEKELEQREKDVEKREKAAETK